MKSADANSHDLRLVIDTIPVMAWILDAQGKLEFLNRRWLDYSGMSMQEAIADPTRAMHPDDMPRSMSKWRAHLGSGRPYEDEMRLRRADGDYRWFLVRTSPLHDDAGNVVRWYGTSTDIEDRRLNAEKLRALSRRLVEVQEAERRELSRELHDHVGQTLTAMLINLELIRNRPAASGDEQLRARVDDVLQLIQTAFTAVEDVMHELRPPLLDDHGLAASLRSHARKFSERTGIALRVAGDRGWRGGSPIDLVLFRIVQEALNNVARHSKANEATITFGVLADKVELTVEDNGVGIGAPETRRRSSYGLAIMQERAESVGGTFDIRRRETGGTRVTVTLPVVPEG